MKGSVRQIYSWNAAVDENHMQKVITRGLKNFQFSSRAPEIRYADTRNILGLPLTVLLAGGAGC
jgi:hypothetical protein